MKIDMFSHAVPQKYVDSFVKNNERGISFSKISGDAELLGRPVLFDVNKRIEVMDRYEGYAQFLVPVCEVLEPFMNPKDTAKLASAFNNALSEWFDKYPEKFVGAAATIPMNNVDAALREIERAITQLGFKGIVMHTPVYQYEEGTPTEKGINFETMKPIDSPEFWPIYEAMSKYNLPIWIHPFGMSRFYTKANTHGWPRDIFWSGHYQFAHSLPYPPWYVPLFPNS